MKLHCDWSQQSFSLLQFLIQLCYIPPTVQLQIIHAGRNTLPESFKMQQVHLPNYHRNMAAKCCACAWGTLVFLTDPSTPHPPGTLNYNQHPQCKKLWKTGWWISLTAVLLYNIPGLLKTPVYNSCSLQCSKVAATTPCLLTTGMCWPVTNPLSSSDTRSSLTSGYF